MTQKDLEKYELKKNTCCLLIFMFLSEYMTVFSLHLSPPWTFIWRLICERNVDV